MNNHTPALTAEQWKRTSIKKRKYRVKDLRNYIKWCKEKYGADCYQIAFAHGQIENIRQSIAPQSAAELNLEIAVSMLSAQRVTEHGVVRGYTNVRSWFSSARAGLMLGKADKVEVPAMGEAVVFVVSCNFDSKLECFTLAELFECEVRNSVSTQQIEGLVDEALRRFEDWCREKQALVEELKIFNKEASEK